MFKRMISIEFSDEELALLDKILESYRSDLRAEIGKTEDFSFKENLKEEETFINEMLQRLVATNFMVVV